MRTILIACECSGVVREAFRLRGWDAWSCDLKPSVIPGQHLECDVLTTLHRRFRFWNAMIAHPPCTYLSSSGLHWNGRTPGRAEKTEAALAFVSELLNSDIPLIALENPTGCIGTRIRPADQWIQPFEFGDDASKKTGLWLKCFRPLAKDLSVRVPGRIVEWPKGSGKMVERWSNQTDSGQNRLGPSEKRAAERAVTYQGIANAMAEQWSQY